MLNPRSKLHMKKVLFIVLLGFTLSTAHAQAQLDNKWYTFSFDPILVTEYNFGNAFFTNKKLDYGLHDLTYADTATVLKVINKNNALYYLSKNKDFPDKISVNIFYILQPGVSFAEPEMAEANSEHDDLNAALKFVEADTIKRPGLTFFSAAAFDKMKALPNAKNITKEQYKKYLLKVLKCRDEFELYAKTHNHDFGVMFFMSYLNNQTRVTLAQLGYNPLIPDNELEDLDRKFADDAELNQLRKQAFEID